MFINEIFEGVNPDQGVATYQQLLLAIKESRATEIDGMTITESQAKYLLKEFKKIAKQHGRVAALEFLGSYGEIGKALHKHALDQAKQLSESLNEISDKTIDSYYDRVLTRQREHEGGKFGPYGSFERLPAKRQRGIDRATKRILHPEWDPTDHNDEEYRDELEENLRKWFKEKWVRFGPDGKIKGDCARGSSSEGKPKCLPQKKAQALGKKKRASAAAKKRREDPNPERKGKAKNVATKVKETYDLTPYEDGHANGESGEPYENLYPEGSKSHAEFRQGWREGYKINHPDVTMEDLDEACWKGYHKDGMKTMFGKKYPNCVKNKKTNEEQGVAETVTDVRSGMSEIYHRLAPKIEKHRDSFLAGQLYDELENYAELHGAEREFKRMMDTARGRAHMEYDTNPGGFHNWFWFLPFENNLEESDLGEEWSEKYKSSINCSNPKGFSQKAHCAGRKKTNESLVQVPHNGKMVTGKVVRVDKGNPESPFYVVDIGDYGSIKVPAHKVKHIDENKSKTITTQDIHDLADSKGILWDNEPSFLKLTKHLTGKEHLDDLDQDQLLTVKQFLEKFDKYEKQLNEKQDACYHKVKSRYKVWPSAYASGALVKCRKVGAKNWGTGGKKK